MKFLSFKIFMLLCISLISTATGYAQKKKPVKKTVHSAAIKPGKKTSTVAANENIKNGITFTSKGFIVSEAYLFFDDETPVPADNKVALNKNVNMLLIIDSGWTETGGRVYPGSKQILKLSNGAEILSSDELFAAFDETGVSVEDARYITLNAIVTELKNKKNHVIVNFRLWDKKGNAEITGSYKLFIK